MTRAAVRIAIVAACLAAVAATAVAATPTLPKFLARRDYIGLHSYWVQVGDTNGDGIPDLIADWFGQFEVLFGNGDGTFRSGPSQIIGNGETSFVAADVNGDGIVDLVLPAGSGVEICLGKGDGTFQTGVTYGVNDGSMYYAVVGDFNNDGIPDVASPGIMGVWLFTGKGDGTFNPGVLVASVSAPHGGGDIAATDFNGDGNLDLAVTIPWGGGVIAPGNGTVVLLGNGNGTFQAPLMLSNPKNVTEIAAGRLPNGHAGIIVFDSQNAGLYAFLGNGAGAFSAPQKITIPAGVGFIAIGDVNGDGIPDLVSAEGCIEFGTPSGGFSSAICYPVESGNQLILADLRNNGLTDIVTNAYSAVSVLLSQGKGRYEDGAWTGVPGAGACGAAADYNGDGEPDLAVATATGVSILLGTGKIPKPFTTGTPIALIGAACVITGDLNGDGIPDLLVAMNGTPNALVSYLGNGDGTFTLKSTTATPSAGGYVVLADFNHDGKLDFATSGNLIALGNGDGTFQTPVAIVSNPPSGGFSNIAVGDINNDGWPDLVLTNSGSLPNNLGSFLLNNHQGGFTQLSWPFGPAVSQAILADLNGDGNLDAVLQGTGGGAYIYLGNGKGSFTYQTMFFGDSIGGGAGFNIVADLNGDGIPDIGVQWGDTMDIFLGQPGATYVYSLSIGTGPAPGSIITENLHGQSAKSGRPDIVAPDRSGGVMVLNNVTK